MKMQSVVLFIVLLLLPSHAFGESFEFDLKSNVAPKWSYVAPLGHDVNMLSDIKFEPDFKRNATPEWGYVMPLRYNVNIFSGIKIEDTPLLDFRSKIRKSFKIRGRSHVTFGLRASKRELFYMKLIFW